MNAKRRVERPDCIASTRWHAQMQPNSGKVPWHMAYTLATMCSQARAQSEPEEPASTLGGDPGADDPHLEHPSVASGRNSSNAPIIGFVEPTRMVARVVARPRQANGIDNQTLTHKCEDRNTQGPFGFDAGCLFDPRSCPCAATGGIWEWACSSAARLPRPKPGWRSTPEICVALLHPLAKPYFYEWDSPLCTTFGGEVSFMSNPSAGHH
jgi:hypothetical protein